MCKPTHTTPTFITESLHPVAYVQLFKRNVKVKVTAYTVIATLIGLAYMARFNCKAMPIIYNDYNCHIKAVELV